MKKAILTLFIAVAVTASYAQTFEKGTNVLSAGVGLGSSLLNYSGSNQTPAISVQFERGSFPVGEVGVISLGGYVGYKSYKYSGKSASYSWDQKWNYTIVGARSAFHFTSLKLDKLDLYGGLMLSYNILKYKYTDNGAYNNGYESGSYGSAAGVTAYVGGRYFFTNNIGAMAELGYGVSYLTLGLSFKF